MNFESVKEIIETEAVKYMNNNPVPDEVIKNLERIAFKQGALFALGLGIDLVKKEVDKFVTQTPEGS